MRNHRVYFFLVAVERRDYFYSVIFKTAVSEQGLTHFARADYNGVLLFVTAEIFFESRNKLAQLIPYARSALRRSESQIFSDEHFAHIQSAGYRARRNEPFSVAQSL